MESELTCPVCSEMYATGLREPVLLPNCGHTFCRICLCSVESAGSLDCPTCRKSHTGSPVVNLPTIFALLSLSENYKRQTVKETLCTHHGSMLEFWCRDCQEALCGHCLLTGHLKDGHTVENSKVFVTQKKKEILNCGSQLVKDIDVKKELIIKKMTELINQIAANTEESEILHSSKIEAERLLEDVSNVNSIESALTSLALVESLHTGTQKIPLSDIKREERNIYDKCTSCSDMDHASNVNRQDSSTLEEETEENGRDNSEHDSCPRENGAAASVIRQSAFRTKAAWPLQFCVVSSDGRRGKLRWENDKLHMYSLSRTHCDAQFMIQLCVVEWLLSAEFPEVFFDLGSEYHQLGRIYIRLYGYLRRAQHFLALCLGSLGPSYKSSKFHGVAKRGAPGETLAGGKYISSENTYSIQGLIPGLEWGGKHIREKREGLVVGASGGTPSEDAFFHICTKDHVGKKFACVFGEVVTGMQVLKAAVQHMLETDVFITDAGVVLSNGT